MNCKHALTALYFLLCSVFSNAQTSPAAYVAKWQTVDSLINKKGLNATALAEVNNIAALARREQNEPQVIRALIYRLKLEADAKEDGVLVSIKELEKEIGESHEAARSILENIQAGLYLQYLQQNRWKFYNRSSLSHPVSTDPATWPIDQLNRKITQLYLASLKDERMLADVSLSLYSPIVIRGNTPHLRPTLFDLLACNALDYFKTGEANIDRPADKFEDDDPEAFGDAAVFVAHRFITTDTLASYYQALLLYQRLIRLHMTDKVPDALVDMDIDRIGFVNFSGVQADKAGLYLDALNRLATKWGDLPTAAEAWYLEAQTYADRASAGNEPEDTSGNIKAKAICERVIAEKDSSEGQTNCRILLYNILRQEVQAKSEKVNIPNEPSRVLVSWRNFTRLYLRIVAEKGQPAEAMPNEIYDTAYWRRLLNKPAFMTLSRSLPPTTDYRLHRVEIAIPSLPAGAYILIASTDSNWSGTGGVMAVQYFSVSNLSYISQGNDYFVVNRKNGAPVPGATVQLWDRTYYDRGRVTLTKAGAYTTDENGHFEMHESSHIQLLEISTPNDHLFLGDPVFTGYARGQANQKQVRSFLFTDRSIYRPGQTVFFKGITLSQDYADHQSEVLTGQTIHVNLRNANNELIDTVTLTSNEYGSWHGMFRLPVGQLNGIFRMETATDGITFSVEEYKRPTFYVEYEKQKGSYRIGDTIRTTGIVKAYAGNGIDGARVSYRVVRKARFPHYWLFWRTVAPYVREQEIAHGETRTDAEGKFRVVFFAAAARGVSPATDPEFTFEVSADVTDINNETRTGMTRIVSGYKAFGLNLDVPGITAGGQLAADSLRFLVVKASNLSGQPVDSRAHISVFPLDAPQRLIRHRLWETPDRWVIPEKEWLDSFPHDEYRQETEKESWDRGRMIWDTTVASNVTALFPGALARPGWYEIEATATDQYGQEVKTIRYMELYDSKTGRPAIPEYVWSGGEDMTAEPGVRVPVAIGSSARDVHVIRSIMRGSVSNIKYDYFSLNVERKDTEVEIGEPDRGGIVIQDIFVADNRVYNHSSVIRVPWTNKELNIRYSTYRDKTLPGSEEKWRLTISGPKGEQVAAEVMTAIYDESLDQFRSHDWMVPYLYPSQLQSRGWSYRDDFAAGYSFGHSFEHGVAGFGYKLYDELLEPRNIGQAGRLVYKGGYYNMMHDKNPDIRWGVEYNGAVLRATPGQMLSAQGELLESKIDVSAKRFNMDTVLYDATGLPLREAVAPEGVVARKDFRETAAFFPDLYTDSTGSVTFSFTMPEALTTWKWMTLAHTRDLAFGYSEKTVVTQKQLMVQPNAPRFLREGDRMELPVKVVNLTDSELTGQMSLQLTDPTTGETADGMFTNRQPNQYFTVGPKQSVVAGFPLDVPFQYNRPLTYKVVAQAGDYSDGEEATLPVVSNRLLVTESLPLNMPGDGMRHFTLDKLLNSGSSETLNTHTLTVEFTANPAWYAVEALPYLAEYPYECSEQVFDRAYANALAARIVAATPGLKQVFDRWRTKDTAALLSNLQKNQELKTVLLEETPWVLQGKSEAEQKHNIALLFDADKMGVRLASALDLLGGMQLQDGSFPWFKGGPGDRYITQYVLAGIGRLQRLQAIPEDMRPKVKKIVAAALSYLDGQLSKDYEAEARAGVAARAGAATQVSALAVQYLYMRSMFNDVGIPGDAFPAVNYYRKKAQQGWVKTNKYLQGMIALALYRTGDVQTAKDIIASLKQNAIRDAELGMYWKGMEGGYYWYDGPIETQALLIEAFREISGDAAIDRDLKTWLLRNKQTNRWPTTKATADACYALLAGNQDWLNAERTIAITLGDKTITWPGGGTGTGGEGGKGGEAGKGGGTGSGGEAGTGYNKQVFDAPFVQPSMGNITVTMKTKTGGSGLPAWGAVYWQYFDQLDQITPPGTNIRSATIARAGAGAGGASRSALSIVKKLFIRRNTERGPVLEPVPENGTLKPGDRVVVRIELRADRDLEYVHMKDMRAACLEPVDVISGYRWQDGLGYYESTKDASTDFFFGRLPRGTYVFEYQLLAGQIGNFSNGITTIECMYAPEFTWHTEGIRVNVEEGP